MAEKVKVPRAASWAVAEQIRLALEPACEPGRCCIVGSLRRGKETVGDCELLYVSRMVEVRDGLFDTKQEASAEGVIIGLVASGILAPRPNVRGSVTWGPRNKLAIHKASGIAVDLFATTEENWFCALVIRTGGKQMNLTLTNGAHRLERNLLAGGSGVECKDGSVIRATSELHLFQLCGVEYLIPEDR